MYQNSHECSFHLVFHASYLIGRGCIALAKPMWVRNNMVNQSDRSSIAWQLRAVDTLPRKGCSFRLIPELCPWDAAVESIATWLWGWTHAWVPTVQFLDSTLEVELGMEFELLETELWRSIFTSGSNFLGEAIHTYPLTSQIQLVQYGRLKFVLSFCLAVVICLFRR